MRVRAHPDAYVDARDLARESGFGSTKLNQLFRRHYHTTPAAYLLRARLAGDIDLSKRTLEKADALIEKSLEVNADKPEGHFLRGEIAFFQERYAAALDHYREAVEQDDKEKGYTAYGINIGYVDILAKQGLCLQRLDRSDRARDVGDRIGEIDPEHPLGKSLREAK